MLGTAVVTINENQWSVSVANTTTELTTGLSGIASLAAGTGMLFVLPLQQVVIVDTNLMLFPIDIIFIKDNTILSIARNISPGYLVEEATPIDMFLEVNVGEAELVEVGDVVDVTITTIQEPGLDINQIISFAIPLAILGFVFGMPGLFGSGSSSKEIRRLGKPRTEEERAKVHKEFYGTKELPQRGKGLEERGELTEGRGLGEPKTEEEREETHYGKYGSRELPERGSGLGEPKARYYIIKPSLPAVEVEPFGKGQLHPHRVFLIIKDYPGIGFTDIWTTSKLSMLEVDEALNKLEWEGYIRKVVLYEVGKCPKHPTCKAWVVFEGKNICYECWNESQRPLPKGEKEEQADWIYAKVGDTEMRGRPIPTGIEFEQVSPSYNQSDLDKAVEIITQEIKGIGERSIHGEPRQRLVEQYGSWAVGRAEAICPEGDVACVTREAKRLIETIRSRYGEEAINYVTIKDSGSTVFHVSDVVSVVAVERENRRVRKLGEREATWQ